MQEEQVEVPDPTRCSSSIYEEVSASMDRGNSDHQNFSRCLYFLTEEDASKIPVEIKSQVQASVQTLLAEDTDFSRNLKEQWLPNLPRFLQDKPMPKVTVLPKAPEQQPQTAKPQSPKETQLSPKKVLQSSQPSPREQHPEATHPPVRPERRGSVPVKKNNGLLSRFRFGGHDKRDEGNSNNPNQSKSL